AGIGKLILARAEYAGAHSASYMIDIKNAGGGVPWDDARLTRDAHGNLIDSTPGRITDVWVRARSDADPQTERDLRESAALDALFPTLMQQAPDAVGIYFIARNGLTRSYPADGSRERESSAFNPFSVPGFEPFGAGSPAPEHHPVWTAPHEGPAGEGLLVTSITPVFDGNEYRGIVAMDLALARLIAQAD